ncbi:hypothetical protein Aduo_018735 [Ancylostoma duodenale]
MWKTTGDLVSHIITADSPAVMSTMNGSLSRGVPDGERSNAVSVRFSHAYRWETSSFCSITMNMNARQMSNRQRTLGRKVPRAKEERREKPTEVLRHELERTGTIDALTGWLKKIVELPPDKRPKDALEFLKKHWNPWHGDLRYVALQNMLDDVQKEIAEVKEKNEELKREIAQVETALLAKKLGALNASAEQRKEIAAAEQAARSLVEGKPAQKKAAMKSKSKPKPFVPRHVASNAAFPDVPGPSTFNSPVESMLVPLHNVPGPSTFKPPVHIARGNPKMTFQQY